MQRIPLLLLILIVFLSSCTPKSTQSAPPALGEGKPCENCVRSEAPRLEVQDHFFRLEGVETFRWESIPKPLGIIPLEKAQAVVQGKCSFCHAFSEDAVAFDFQSNLESWISEKVSRDSVYLLIAGLGIPEKDSLVWEKWLDTLRTLPYMDQQPLTSMLPWLERPAGAYFEPRKTPASIRTYISRLAARSGVRSLLIPLYLKVEILPKEGEEGAYILDVLWSLWDAEGERLWMLASHAKYLTLNDVPPDRNWSEPLFQWTPPSWNTSER